MHGSRLSGAAQLRRMNIFRHPKQSPSGCPTLRANISETVLVLLINEQGEKEKGRDEREFSRCCSFPRGFGWRGTERRRAKRAAAQCSGSQSGGPLPVGRAA